MIVQLNVRRKLACMVLADYYLELDVSMRFDCKPSFQCLNTQLAICLAEAMAESEVRKVQDRLYLDYSAYS